MRERKQKKRDANSVQKFVRGGQEREKKLCFDEVLKAKGGLLTIKKRMNIYPRTSDLAPETIFYSIEGWKGGGEPASFFKILNLLLLLS